MSIASIIRNGKGKAGHGGSWEVTSENDFGGHTLYRLYHYGHQMLCWTDVLTSWGAERNVIRYASMGHGSVSDQGGMNIAFRELGLPWYYSRKLYAIIDNFTSDEPGAPPNYLTLDEWLRY